jgi:D-serine deaminase-like pyridoxal phosphate-dependent protein
VNIDEIPTPALVVDLDLCKSNIAQMAAALPGPSLRPHVKAHKCTALARLQRGAGHPGFTCATIKEAEGLFDAGLGDDLFIANEVVDARRIGDLVQKGAKVMLAVDSEATIEAAASGGVEEVIIDVDVGMPRCGCDEDDAARLADLARSLGLRVEGVMGYEGHAVHIRDLPKRNDEVQKSAYALLRAHDLVGGKIVSGGGTGSYNLNSVVTEVQAGSYVLMDGDYGTMALPFDQALLVHTTVISVHKKGWAVADAGTKAIYGTPHIVEGGDVMFSSDEHLAFVPEHPVRVGDRLHVIPGQLDPTIALHKGMWVARGTKVVERWQVDLSGW